MNEWWNHLVYKHTETAQVLDFVTLHWEARHLSFKAFNCFKHDTVHSVQVEEIMQHSFVVVCFHITITHLQCSWTLKLYFSRLCYAIVTLQILQALPSPDSHGLNRLTLSCMVWLACNVLDSAKNGLVDDISHTWEVKQCCVPNKICFKLTGAILLFISNLSYPYCIVKFEIPAVVKMLVVVFWILMPCVLLSGFQQQQHFVLCFVMFYLHLYHCNTPNFYLYLYTGICLLSTRKCHIFFSKILTFYYLSNSKVIQHALQLNCVSKIQPKSWVLNLTTYQAYMKIFHLCE